jgi:hypothetical protein
MLTAYFDETGHAADPQLSFAGMAGFVAPSAAWTSFESQWKDTLKNAQLSEPFHMKDFAHSIGQFKSWKGNEDKRRLLLRRLIEIIRETNATPIGAAVSLRDFESLTEAQQSMYRGPYYICFQTCTRGAAIEAVFEDPAERVAMVYAFNGEYGTNKDGGAEQLWQAIKKHVTLDCDLNSRMGSYTSSTPAELCPLQAADLFAYELCHEFENRIKRPGDRMRWALRQILRMYRIPSPQIRLLDRKELLRLIAESKWPDQTGVEELEKRQMLSAQESMMRWLTERGEFAADLWYENAR